ITATHPGMSFTYRFDISNEGPVPITVTSIGASPAEQDGTGITTTLPVRMQKDLSAPASIRPGWEPFRPFGLAPDQETAIEMQVVMHRCPPRGSSPSWGREPVTFTVFGITRHVDFQPNVQIELLGDSCAEDQASGNSAA
ncbi:MAG: hypothetical protein ABI828_04200, partial [Actinomycetota bacterium]